MGTNLKVATCLWSGAPGQDAARFCTSLLPDAAVVSVMSPDGPALMVEFTLARTPCQALNGGPPCEPSPAASIAVSP